MYGRLADPTCTIGTDPRADPRMVKALAPFGLDGHMPSPAVTPDAPMDKRLAAVTVTEQRMGAVLDALAQNIPSPNGASALTMRGSARGSVPMVQLGSARRPYIPRP